MRILADVLLRQARTVVISDAAKSFLLRPPGGLRNAHPDSNAVYGYVAMILDLDTVMGRLLLCELKHLDQFDCPTEIARRLKVAMTAMSRSCCGVVRLLLTRPSGIA